MGYYHGSDRPYLISGSDDRRVKIWDYQVLAPTLLNCKDSNLSGKLNPSTPDHLLLPRNNQESKVHWEEKG